MLSKRDNHLRLLEHKKAKLIHPTLWADAITPESWKREKIKGPPGERRLHNLYNTYKEK